MPVKKKPGKIDTPSPALNQLPEAAAEKLAPLLQQAKNLELPILRTSEKMLQAKETLLQMQGQRDKILAYQRGMIEAHCLASGLDPQTTILAPDGKTLIIK